MRVSFYILLGDAETAAEEMDIYASYLVEHCDFNEVSRDAAIKLTGVVDEKLAEVGIIASSNTEYIVSTKLSD